MFCQQQPQQQGEPVRGHPRGMLSDMGRLPPKGRYPFDRIFTLSPSFPFCVIPCDASSSNIGLCVIISQVPCELCLDGLVV